MVEELAKERHPSAIGRRQTDVGRALLDQDRSIWRDAEAAVGDKLDECRSSASGRCQCGLCGVDGKLSGGGGGLRGGQARLIGGKIALCRVQRDCRDSKVQPFLRNRGLRSVQFRYRRSEHSQCRRVVGGIDAGDGRNISVGRNTHVDDLDRECGVRRCPLGLFSSKVSLSGRNAALCGRNGGLSGRDIGLGSGVGGCRIVQRSLESRDIRWRRGGSSGRPRRKNYISLSGCGSDIAAVSTAPDNQKCRNQRRSIGQRLIDDQI